MPDAKSPDKTLPAPAMALQRLIRPRAWLRPFARQIFLGPEVENFASDPYLSFESILERSHSSLIYLIILIPLLGWWLLTSHGICPIQVAMPMLSFWNGGSLKQYSSTWMMCPVPIH